MIQRIGCCISIRLLAVCVISTHTAIVGVWERTRTYSYFHLLPYTVLVCIHSFSLWLLPQGLEYGFMNEFNADQILFMRGDFVHAGVPTALYQGGTWSSFRFLQLVGKDDMHSGCARTGKTLHFRGNTQLFH